jgi:hypothetical protein
MAGVVVPGKPLSQRTLLRLFGEQSPGILPNDFALRIIAAHAARQPKRG